MIADNILNTKVNFYQVRSIMATWGKKRGRRLCYLFLILGQYLKVQKKKKKYIKVHLVEGNVVTFSKPHITALKASLNLVSQSFIT